MMALTNVPSPQSCLWLVAKSHTAVKAADDTLDPGDRKCVKALGPEYDNAGFPPFNTNDPSVDVGGQCRFASTCTTL
jgi:hypothetical protein